MDTREAIQVAREPAVLSISFNASSTRFMCGLENGFRSFCADNCIRVIKESPSPKNGIGIAAALDDRHVAIVGGGRKPNFSQNKLQYWDNVAAKMVKELDLAEPIIGLRVTTKYLAIILAERTILMRYTTFEDTGLEGPGTILGLFNTASNPYALCCIRGDRMILPGLTPGQVQVVQLTDRTKKIVRAHTSELRQMDFSRDGELFVTASKQGTLIRVFSTSTLSQTHDFRRGVDPAIIYSLSISPNNQFVASTSDKGTLHIYDLRPPVSEEPTRPSIPERSRSSISRGIPTKSGRPNSIDFDALSLPSASSSPRTAGGFYGPPADLAHIPPSTGPSAFSAIAKLPGMPRAFSDTRSMTSTQYHLGTDAPNWQGQPLYTATTLPNGHKGRVKNPNVPVPGLPDGRPPKGVLAWDPAGGDRRLWCVGGGADARWEVFELCATDEGQKLRIFRRGWRAYLTRQFPEVGTE